MPSLTVIAEGSESLSTLTEGSESLSSLSEGVESLSLLEELDPRLGFFPGSSLYEAPYPFPGSTSYPGDTTGLSFIAITEGSETLTVLTEG